MFTKTQDASERLAVWRQIRQQDLTLEEILSEFSKIKLLSRYIDFYTVDNWPNVFDIVTEGYFCQSGVTLVLAATLYHKKIINSNQLRFDAISNHTTGADGLVLVDGNNCYNFNRNKVVPLEVVKENSLLYTSHIITIDKLFD